MQWPAQPKDLAKNKLFKGCIVKGAGGEKSPAGLEPHPQPASSSVLI